MRSVSVSKLKAELSAYLADQLDVALTSGASAAGFEIVTRNRLCEVIRENKLWVDDRFDPSLNRKLGRLSQADYMATGQVTALAREVTVSIRLIETETGRSVWAHSRHSCPPPRLRSAHSSLLS